MLTTAEMNAGRKLSARADEPWVEGSDQLVRVDYTYWTLAYILSATGELSCGPLSGVYYKEISSPYSTYIRYRYLVKILFVNRQMKFCSGLGWLSADGSWGGGGAVGVLLWSQLRCVAYLNNSPAVTLNKPAASRNGKKKEDFLNFFGEEHTVGIHHRYCSPVFRIRIHWFRFRIQHFMLNTISDPGFVRWPKMGKSFIRKKIWC